MSDIVVRKVKFEFEFDGQLRDVLPGIAPADETYLVAFSMTMPYLEPYLIRTFRSVLDQIADPDLAADVKAFISQEAQHFQNHRRANEVIKAQLAPDLRDRVQAVEDRLDADYRRFTATKSDRFNLVYAEGFEAMTCAMALSFLEQAAAGTGIGSDGRFGAWEQLWAWHAAEEIEHRTVAFEVYEHIVGSWPGRVAGSLRAQLHFQRAIERFQRVLLPTLGASPRPRVPGWLRGGSRRYGATFLPGYDPGELDPGPMVEMILAPYTPS